MLGRSLGRPVLTFELETCWVGAGRIGMEEE